MENYLICNKSLEGVRDHIKHLIYTFLLGLYFAVKWRKINIYKVNGHDDKTFEWKLCSLMHDIGYKYEWLYKMLTVDIQEVNDFSKKNQVYSPLLACNFKIKGINKLTRRKDSFEIITKRFYEWDLKINAKEEYEKMKRYNCINHGIIGSLYLLKMIDILYKKNNVQDKINYEDNDGIIFGREFFNKKVVSVCASIFLHSLNLEENKIILDLDKQPLAYILKLSDELQEWGREISQKNCMESNNVEYDIYMENRNGSNKIVIICPREEIAEKIKNKLHCLKDIDNKISIIAKQ